MMAVGCETRFEFILEVFTTPKAFYIVAEVFFEEKVENLIAILSMSIEIITEIYGLASVVYVLVESAA